MKFGLNMPAHIDSWKDMTVAEDLGFTSAWFYDSQMLYSDIYATMTLVAEHTKRIKCQTRSSRDCPRTRCRHHPPHHHSDHCPHLFDPDLFEQPEASRVREL